MKSEWKITFNPMMGDKKYGVYRIRDMNAPDHSGNREYAPDWYDNLKDAECMAVILNSKDLPTN